MFWGEVNRAEKGGALALFGSLANGTIPEQVGKMHVIPSRMDGEGPRES